MVVGGLVQTDGQIIFLLKWCLHVCRCWGKRLVVTFWQQFLKCHHVQVYLYFYIWVFLFHWLTFKGTTSWINLHSQNSDTFGQINVFVSKTKRKEKLANTIRIYSCEIVHAASLRGISQVFVFLLCWILVYYGLWGLIICLLQHIRNSFYCIFIYWEQ